ncbi:dihydrofolate reductase [Verrucomicrobiaceae bacterium N1E253]|uniref:Dihydrofolate reductase n=1 Tax=Oceaniferula marina TaxID=2748318 RepID=A0A851GB52_9BACT|nr:dihydrofolate reductase [Oceaniferula marina]NWK54646.1 dihydrofolate reductase [Oceaniferula marina]
MTLTAIVAMTPDRIIGKDGTLPWHLPEDLKLFKRHTTGNPIVMGRKTWDSIGKPLPKRQNIVITRDPDWSADGAEVIHSPKDLEKLELITDKVFIIGGAQIYSLFLPQLDEILVSHVHENYPGDTRFPEFEHQFPKVSIEEVYDTFELRRYQR